MRPPAISILLLLAPISATQIPSGFTTFDVPHTENALLPANDSRIPEHDFLKRQLGSGGCPANFNPCMQDGYGGACCTRGSICTTDGARNVACCPNGATCTGTVGGIISATGGFGTPTTATATTTAPVSVLTNEYFPFPIIATSYPNSASCNVAYEACQTNYAACTVNLQGGGFGVTVVAPQGGVTVSPTAQNLGEASATSICSSLSQRACYGIVSENCAQFGQGTGGDFVVKPTGNHAARPTAGCFAAVGMAAGAGIAAQMMGAF